ncbi:MAG: hypothetical protein KC933_37520 [Myxococcales bacterium]|nr:hypothetical protein [Myxococcales bacterium]MCB9650415.1 hypothetical protein [Deltaproteobacteria bacterium]
MTSKTQRPGVRELLFPTEDSASQVQVELRDQFQQAMQVLGVVSIILPLSGFLSLQVADLAHVAVFPAAVRSVTDATSVSSIILGITVFLLAKRVTTPAQGRTVLFVFAVLSASLLIRQELLVREDGPMTSAVVTFLLVIAVAPFRPREALALGLVLTVVFVGINALYPASHVGTDERASRLLAGTVPMLVLTATGAVLSGVLYQHRAHIARVRAERERLREKLAEVADVAEVSPVPTMRFHLSGELLWANPAALHYARKVGAPDRDIKDYLPPGFKDRIPEATAVSHTQMVSSYEAHGRFFTVNYKPVPGADEFIVTLTDVTAETRAQRKAERFADELKKAQVKLVQTEKMASLGNLVAGVAHEINTPLGAMKSNNQVLQRSLERLPEAEAERRDKLVESMGQLLDVNHQAIARIDGIVDSLRRFARLDQSERGKVDLVAELENTLRLVQHELRGRVEIHKEFEAVPELACYPNQLNQVFMNLIVNAIQSIEGEGHIYLEVKSLPGAIVVRVRDTGCGIAPQHLAKIFDPGFTTKGVGVGTGLGLSIVHRIVEEHRGRIDVQSEVGVGSTFTVQLPLDATTPP